MQPGWLAPGIHRSVRALAEAFLATRLPLHCLVNSAEVLAPGPFEVTEDGLET